MTISEFINNAQIPIGIKSVLVYYFNKFIDKQKECLTLKRYFNSADKEIYVWEMDSKSRCLWLHLAWTVKKILVRKPRKCSQSPAHLNLVSMVGYGQALFILKSHLSQGRVGDCIVICILINSTWLCLLGFCLKKADLLLHCVILSLMPYYYFYES